MLVDILFVAVVIGILIAIYKTKFSQTKTTQDLKAQIVRQLEFKKKQSQKPDKTQQKPNNSTQWTGQQQQGSQQQSEQSDSEGTSNTGNSRKQLYKQQKRRQKQQRKQAQNQFLESEKQKRQQYEKQIEQKQREQEQKRKKQQEYIEQMREDQRKRKQQEFNKWKDMFSVDETGITKEAQDVVKRKEKQLQNSLREYLIKKKLTLLEDASHKFSLTTKDLVQKIKKLENQQRISGVFDERGKYLYIEQREWDAVRSYILAKGRLKKRDMMAECAKIIKIPEQLNEDLVKLVNQVQPMAQ